MSVNTPPPQPQPLTYVSESMEESKYEVEIEEWREKESRE